jgi:hypothetical protein
MDDVDFDFAPLMQPPAAGAPRPTPTQPRAPVGEIEFDFSGTPGKPPAPARSPQQQARDEAQAKAAYERMTRSTLPESVQQAVSGLGSYGRAFAPGVFEYLPALGAKALGKLGVRGYEQAAEAPISDLRSRARAIEEEAAAKYPKTAAAGTVGGLGAGIATLPTVTKLPFFGRLGTMGSGAATGALYGGVSEGAEKGTLEGAGLGAGLGLVAGGTLSPLVEKALSGTAALAGVGRPVVDQAGNLTQEAINIARGAGLSDAKIAELTPELIRTFSQRGLTPAAAREAPFARFGIEPKRGMVSEDPMQLKREFQYGSYEPIAQQAATGVESMLGGSQIPLRDAISQAVDRGAQEAARLKSSYEQAYRTAGEAPGSFSRESLTNIGDKLLGGMAKDETALAYRGSDHVQSAAKKLNENLGQFLETGDPAAPRIMWRNFRAVEEARKGLNQYLSSATDKTDRAGMRRLINDFDQHIEDSINNGAFSGDRSVSGEWRNARRLFSQYQDKFGYKKSGEEAGSLMKQIIEQQKTPEEVGNMMFNFASTGEASAKASALKTYSQLKRALGPNSPELRQIEQSFLQQLMTPVKEGEKASPKMFAETAKQIDSFLKGSQAAFANKILGEEDRRVLQLYADTMRQAAISPKDLTPEKMSRITKFMYDAAPAVASAALYSLGNIHPVLAAGVSIPVGWASRFAALRSGELAAQRAANLPPETVSRMYDLPAVRRAVPLMYEGAQQQAHGGRIGRATGGGIGRGMTAQMLIAAVERAKANGQKSTESLLEAPDEHIVKALKVAKENI